QNEAHNHECKLRVRGLSKHCSVYDVHVALASYGDIIRIDIQRGTHTCAYVIFRPPPKQIIWNQPIRIENHHVQIDAMAHTPYFCRSPVNRTKEYSEFTLLFADSISFGSTIANKKMAVMHTIESKQQVQLGLNLREKELDVRFRLSIKGKVRRYRFCLPISLLEHIYKVPGDSDSRTNIIIPFDSPPKFYMHAEGIRQENGKSEIEKTFKPSDRVWSDWNAWYRQTDILTEDSEMVVKNLPLTPLKGQAIIDIGQWTTYQLSFDSTSLTGAHFENFKNALQDHGVGLKSAEYTCVPTGIPRLWEMLDEEFSNTHPHINPSSPTFKTKRASDELATGRIALTFPVRYQLEVCLTNGHLQEHSITLQFLQRLSEMDQKEAVYVLEKVADKQMVLYDPMDVFKTRIKGKLSKKVPSYCVLTHAAIVTPTKIHVVTPVVETSNRIIRRHIADADRFLRVKFSDEKTEGKVYGSQKDNKMEAVFRRIQRALVEGIVVAGRYYEFLAFGNSQFRENGAYFYAPTSNKSAADIRASMGTFNHIKTPAKFAARVGQCFSTTRPIKSINVKLGRINDVERNGYNFTDGVGKISPFLAMMAAEELGLHNAFEDPPSLFQFRLGGCKGVLALDPNAIQKEVFIRPSQYKFAATNEGLEIIRASAFASACFNRQLIVVLSTLGVHDNKFIEKQREMVRYLELAMVDKNVALEKLRRNIDLNQITLVMAAMILDGFMDTKEPFIMSLLQIWRAYNIKSLKEKARIVIEKGAFLLGCTDETGTLRGHYDDSPQTQPNANREEMLATLPEIFVQISDPAKPGHYKVIEGVCLLARNPSLHPGDIRVVRAVGVPALHHLKNVVVLPQTGDRDLSNMCSGGDLDGDDYLVMWDTDFLPESINETPMSFIPEKPTESSGPITIRDITTFFVEYMKSDTLAQIAHAHLAQADFNEEGVRDEKCLALAELHSRAVDYPKSGLPAVMKSELRPQKWPHFMEKKCRPENIYRSTKILGRLYDQIRLVDFQPQYENTFDRRVLDAFELEDGMLKEAASIKASYDQTVLRLMAKHDMHTEFEVWAIFPLSHNRDTNRYTFAEDFGKTVAGIKHQFREACIKAAGSSESEHILPFIAAMYAVTAREMEEALRECRAVKLVGGQQVPQRKMDSKNMPLISFPWLFPYQLGKIATGQDMRSSQHWKAIQQPVSKKHRKQADVTVERDFGEVTTKDGITHFGELLKLDF
ncbi:RdRP-domain-containing protein, partial [Amniculicola lignicola CBS 123094]